MAAPTIADPAIVVEPGVQRQRSIRTGQPGGPAHCFSRSRLSTCQGLRPNAAPTMQVLPEPVAAARATLVRATRFVAAGLPAPPHLGRDGSNAPPKVVGNALRELDRFFQILLDAVIDSHGLPSSDDRRNTIVKLMFLPRSLTVADGDAWRLRALGRSRDCLFHTGGIVRRTDVRGGTWMTAGWPAAPDAATLRRCAPGEQLAPSPADLANVCRFYDRLGDALVTVR